MNAQTRDLTLKTLYQSTNKGAIWMLRVRWMSSTFMPNNCCFQRKDVHLILYELLLYISFEKKNSQHAWKLNYEEWATAWQNQQNSLCAQQNFRSAWASIQSDQGLRCALWRSQGPIVSSCGQQRLWSDWVHRSFCWFCRAAAQMSTLKKTRNIAAARQNQQNDLCAQRRLKSAWASAQSDQSLQCPLTG